MEINIERSPQHWCPSKLSSYVCDKQTLLLVKSYLKIGNIEQKLFFKISEILNCLN